MSSAQTPVGSPKSQPTSPHSTMSASSSVVTSSKTPKSQTPPSPKMAGVNPPLNRMDAIVAARYAPLVLPQPMNSSSSWRLP
jgi:hypothetical protein